LRFVVLPAVPRCRYLPPRGIFLTWVQPAVSGKA